MKNSRIVIALFAALLFLPEFLSACPNCKEAYAADGHTPVASGFNASIYFMMAMPFVVLGVFALRLWLAQRPHGADGMRA